MKQLITSLMYLKLYTKVLLITIISIVSVIDLMAQDKNVLFIAGAPSHGFGNHEHLGGSKLLAETIEEAEIGITTRVVSGWPDDLGVFDNIDAVVLYANGGDGHFMLEYLDEFRQVMDRGVGLVAIHYAVEVPRDDAGAEMLEWIGGYFELDWSVNPFWTISPKVLPTHPITNGITPFQIRDEWYYHMRFPDNMENITPILTDLPPKESLIRGDGGHSNNPHVREAILLREEQQHTAWAYERLNGGRGFGFTGGHYHWNWGHDDFRRLVANAIVWSSGSDVPENGLNINRISALELAELTDDPIPDDWDHNEVQKMLDEVNK